MESKNNIVYGFTRHCLQDEEANRGGIPSREAHWLKRLGWRKDSPETQAFYNAIYILQALNSGKHVTVEDVGGMSRINI